MSQVEVTVNGKNYQIICDDGQEARLAELGEYLEKRVQELKIVIFNGTVRFLRVNSG